MDGTIEYPLVKPDELAGEAWAAMHRQDADAALVLWQTLREHSPDRSEGYIWPIQVLWQSGRLDAADEMAVEAFAQFPDHPELFVQHAWIAATRQNWDEAVVRWARVRERAPERIEGYVWGARALWQAGQIDEAEALTTASLERHSQNTDLLIEHVVVAAVRQDWAMAAERFEHARLHAEDPARVEQSLLWLETRLNTAPVASPSEILPAMKPARRSTLEPSTKADEVSPSALMLAFESIGERCDFGAVQRHFGVEPLGLLRFAWTRFESLIAALEDRFAAVGTVDDTEFARYGDETILRMKKYELIFHTFVYKIDDEPPEKREAFYQQQRRRLLFLKEKLVADLEDPQKICIYSTNQWASDAHVQRLFAVLRGYGPNSLLYVRPADGDRAVGTVEALEDGLYAGYFGGLAEFVRGGQPDFAQWRELCSRTYQLARARSADAGFFKSLL